MSITSVVHRMAMSEEKWLQQAVRLLGGNKIFGAEPPTTRLELHIVLLHGLPNLAAVHLVDHLSVLDRDQVIISGIGMSPRTFLRHKHERKGRLDTEHSSRAWKFAEVLAKATSIFGSKEEAERWLDRPATGLDRQRPLDLLETQTGTELVDEFLQRLEYGVYA